MVDAIFRVNNLCNEYHFVNEEQNPDVIIFGPYGDKIPKKGNYIRVGYYCENIMPNLDICDWAFGIPTETYINSPKYTRIQWQGFDPRELIKSNDYNPEQILTSKTKFCNFLYSHQVPYREAFFKQLSKYKRVDSPGKSMNNMSGIDTIYSGDRWSVKKQFLSDYKFTIAFENDVFPGYQTEKFYDAAKADSIPVYCGDPLIGEIFNKNSFINTLDIIPVKNETAKNFLQEISHYDFNDYRPAVHNNLYYKLRRKFKTLGNQKKMSLLLNNLDFSPVIEKIINLDKNPEAYIKMLKEPWLRDNKIPEDSSVTNRWREIFNAAGN